MSTDLFINNTTVDKICYDTVSYPNGTKKIFVFNPYVTDPMHNFWYKIDRCKLLTKSSNSVRIALPNNQKLIDSIDSLDKKIDTVFDSIPYPSMNRKDSMPVFMNLNIDSSAFVFSDTDQKINLIDVPNGSYVSVAMELEHVLYAPKKCVKVWRGLQIKSHKSYSFDQSIFKKDQKPTLVVKSVSTVPPPPPPPPKPEDFPIRYVPSTSDLLFAKSVLRKTPQESETKSETKNDSPAATEPAAEPAIDSDRPSEKKKKSKKHKQKN